VLIPAQYTNQRSKKTQARCRAGAAARLLGIDLAKAARPGTVRKIEEPEREEKTGNLPPVPGKMSENIELGLPWISHVFEDTKSLLC